MAKIKSIRCPQCSAIHPEKIAEGEYKCTYCDAIFHVEIPKPVKVQDVFNTLRGHKPTQLTPYEMKRVGRAVRVFVYIVLLSIVAGVALPIYFATRTTSETITTEGIKPQSGWQSATTDSKKYFIGSKGSVVWKMMKETGDRLDSARYTLVILDLKSSKRLASYKWTPTMTWRESFDFSKDYYDRVFAIGDTVWVTSGENRLQGLNMYTGKTIITPEHLEDAYKELAPGISSAEEIYSKPALKINTDDGLEYAFVPGNKLVLERQKFDKYVRDKKSIKTFFALNQEPRPKLWKIKTDVYLYEKTGMIGHWLANNRKANKNNYMLNHSGVKLLDSVQTPTVFYKGNLLWWNDVSAVVVYRESMAKKAAALVACINDDGTEKWKTSLDQIKGMSEVFKNGQYVQYYIGEKELLIVHESANQIISSIDLETGRINWSRYNDK
jgi:hypothetical protein